MFRASKILVATDLSEAADEAVRRADGWARASGGELSVCFALPEPLRYEPVFASLRPLDPVAQENAEAEATRAVTERVTALTGRAAGSFRVRIARGSAVAGILAEAEHLKADLLVVGSRGLEGLDRLLLGSIAEGVVRHASCPVLVARTSPEEGPVLAATDFSDASKAALEAAAVSARWLKSALSLVHVIDVAPPTAIGLAMSLGATWVSVPEEDLAKIRVAARSMLEQTLAQEGLNGSVLVVEGRSATAITDAAKQLQARLLVVGTLGRTGLTRLALGSVAENVVRHAPCSVLVLRAD